LAAIYLLWAYQRAFHGAPAVAGGSDEASVAGNGHGGPAPERHVGLRDLHGVEYAILVPLIAAVLWLGVYPKPLLSRIEPATKRTVGCVTAVAQPPPVVIAPHQDLCAGAQGV